MTPNKKKKKKRGWWVGGGGGGGGEHLFFCRKINSSSVFDFAPKHEIRKSSKSETQE